MWGSKLTKYRKILFICLIAVLGTACLPQKKAAEDVSKIKVSNGDMAFSIEELKTEPGQAISFDLFNGLKKEKLKFYLLKDGEDPILVQHIKAQQGDVPKEYFLFESEDIEPNTSVAVSFDAPKEEGIYAYVGVSDLPRETMVGRLIVEKKIEVLDEAEKGVN